MRFNLHSFLEPHKTGTVYVDIWVGLPSTAFHLFITLFAMLLRISVVLFAFIYLLSPPTSHAQFLSQIRSFSTVVSNDVAIDDAGNAYITGGFIGTADFVQDSTTGFSLTSKGLKDIFIAKLNAQGRPLWGFSIGGIAGGPGIDDEGLSIEVSPAGNIYVAGYFQGTADFDPGSGIAERTSNGFRDAFLASYDDTGGFRWVESFGGTADDLGHDIGLYDDEAVYFTGLFRETGTLSSDVSGSNAVNSAGEEDGFLISFAPDAELNWIVRYGDISVDKGNRVDTNGAGTVYLYGIYSRDVDFDPSSASTLLSSLNGSQDGVLATYLQDGTFNWAISLGGAQLDGAAGLAVDNSGNAFVTGDFIGTVNFNPSGVATELTSNGRDQYIAAYTPQGLLDWIKPVGTGFALGSDIAVNGQGHVLVTGFFSGDVFPDPQSVEMVTSNGEQDILLASYFADGNFRWAQGIGGRLSEVSTGVAIDEAGAGYLTGFFEDDVDFNPGTDTLLATSKGEYDGFLTKYGSDGSLAVSIETPRAALDEVIIDVYPNPTTNRIALSYVSNVVGAGELELIDALGRLVQTVDIPHLAGTQTTIHVEVSTISAGTYFIRLKNSNKLTPFTIIR